MDNILSNPFTNVLTDAFTNVLTNVPQFLQKLTSHSAYTYQT